MASVMPGLLPDSTGVQFTARPALRTRDSSRNTARSSRSSSVGSIVDNGYLSANASLSSIEIEALLREKVRSKSDSIIQAFKAYDVDQTFSVTKGEFRRVLEAFCTPLTTDQFEAVLAKVTKNPNGTVRYADFLDKFHSPGASPVGRKQTDRAVNGIPRFSTPPTPKEINVDMIEKLLKEKIEANLKSVVKGLQLFDYNRDGRIQRHEMRRVIENYCFKLSDQQYDKLWQRYDFHHTGMVSYKDFLSRLGVTVQARQKASQEGAIAEETRDDDDFALNWQQNTPNPHLRNYKKQQEDEAMLQAMSFREIEIEFRRRMKDNYVNLKKAFMTFDTHLDGFISIEDLRSILTQFTIPMSKQLFSQLMEKCGVRATGKIDWENFLEKFQDPVLVGNGQTLPIRPNHKFFPVKEGIQTVEVDDIWKLLYKHVQSNYGSLKQAFLQFDINRKGRVSRTELRNILEKFHIQLQEEQFKQLLEKIDPFHTNNISYQNFLELFEERDSLEGHKWLHSVHKVNEHTRPAIMAWETIEEILKEKITEYWRNFSAAILDHDHSGDGHISQRNLKKVIDTYILPVSDEHFQSMVIRCEDRTDTQVNYVEFLEKLKVDVRPGDLQGLSTQIFSGSLDREAQRLEDLNYRNQKMSGIVEGRTNSMTAEEVIVRIKDRMAQHSQDFRQAFLGYDRRAKGCVSKRDFRKILGIIALQRCRNFLLTTRLAGRVNDLKYTYERCVTTLVHETGIQEKLDYWREMCITNPMKPIDTYAELVDSYGTEYEHYHSKQIKGKQLHMKCCGETRLTVLDSRGSIQFTYTSTTNSCNRRCCFGSLCHLTLYYVLGTFGMVMSDEQFNILISKLNFNAQGQMYYSDFISNFYDPRHGGPGEDIQRSGNHRVNPIRGDQFGMTIEEVENKLASKLRENFANLRGAFYKFDENHKGALTKESFRRLLDSFMCFMSDEQFEEFCNKHGITKQSRITYPEFLDRFEVRDTVEGHKWLKSVHRFNETYPTPQLSAEDAFDLIRTKAHQQFKDLSQAFIKIGTNKSRGVLKRRDLRQLLLTFVMAVTDEEFQKLWLMFDPENRGYITFEAFLQKIGASEFTPGDLFGMSTKIIDHSRQFLEDHNEDQQIKQERITHLQANRTGFMTVEEVETALKDKIRDNYDDFYKAFRKYDTEKKGVLSINEVQKVLIDFNLFLDDDQFFTLLDRIGLTTRKSRLNYDQFLAAFEEGRKSSYGMRKEDVKIEEQPNLTNQEAEHRLRELAAQQVEVLERAFGAFDKDNSNRIPISEFRRVLDLFCFKMTEAQWKFLLPKLQIVGDRINYCLFLDSFSMSEQEYNRAKLRARMRELDWEDSERWLSSLQKSLKSQDPTLMPVDEVEERIREAVMAHPYNLAQAFQEADYANMGVVSKDDFKTVINKHLFRMTDEQYEKLWPSLVVNEFGNVNYHEFLKKFSSEFRPSQLPPPTPMQRSNTALNMNVNTKRPESMALRRSTTRFDMIRPGAMSRSHSRMVTPIVNAEMAENVVKSTIYRNWKQIQQLCRQKDTDNSGTINVVDLKEILVKYGVDLGSQEFLDLLMKYDLKENGRFCYSDFLRHFILHLKPQDEPRSLLVRRKIATPKVQRSPGSTCTQFFDAMLRLQDTVAGNWKEMRRGFRALDPTGSGVVDSAEFRHVLRQFNVNLDEDEFYHLMSYYDKHMDGKIGYNDFIRAYLNQS